MKLAQLGPLIREGSAKNIYRVDATDIAFRFTDDFSVFDVGKTGYQIPGKAQAVCACAVKSFNIARQIGVPTHFVEQLDHITVRVKEAQVITNRALTITDENYVVPAEWIYRLCVAGSIDRDFRSGKKRPSDYGLPADKIPEVGAPFPYPVHHFTTKFEDFDREVTNEEVCAIAGISVQDQGHYWSMIDRLTGAMALVLARAGYALLDGKMECLMGPGRVKLIGDVFGTPDEDRFVPLNELRRGIIEHHSKEYIRQILIQQGYYDKLMEARKKNQPDPPIPPLSEKIISEISWRYKSAAEAYAQVRL